MIKLMVFSWRYTFLFFFLAIVILFTSGCPPSDPPPEPPPKPTSGQWGQFIGNVASEWEDDGRNMRLLQDFKYVDPEEKTWISLKDSVIDGASIPRAFWSVIGGPFSGKYRKASVVHDTACDYNKINGKESWQNVHLMFYKACRCGGVKESKAKVMYWAVYNGGPRWVVISQPSSSETPSTTHVVSIDPVPIEKQIVSLVRKRTILPESVYSEQKVQQRVALLAEIREEDKKLTVAKRELKEANRLVEESKLKQIQKFQLLEGVRIEHDSAKDEVDALKFKVLTPQVMARKKQVAEDQLKEVERNKLRVERELSVAKNKVKRLEMNQSTARKKVEMISLSRAELVAKKRPEEELVDMPLVANKVEAYISKQNLSLAEIESLKLEEVLK